MGKIKVNTVTSLLKSFTFQDEGTNKTLSRTSVFTTARRKERPVGCRLKASEAVFRALELSHASGGLAWVLGWYLGDDDPLHLQLLLFQEAEVVIWILQVCQLCYFCFYCRRRSCGIFYACIKTLTWLIRLVKRQSDKLCLLSHEADFSQK